MAAPARAAAYLALRQIDGADLGETLARTRDPLEDSRDRALATDLIIGTLRWRGSIDYQIARLSGRSLERLDREVLDALRLGAYQLLYRERVPASAAVNDSVALVKTARKKSAAPLVNAVLRRLARERGALTWPTRDSLIEHLAVVQSHPSWLVERWVARYGAEVAEEWLRFNNLTPALTIADNRLAGSREDLISALAAEGVRTSPTRIAPHGLYILDGRPLITLAFSSGRFVVQDEASQLVPELVAARLGERVLDACAAPGGKTVALAGQLEGSGVVVATDVRARRMRVLAGTVERCGVTNAHLVQIPAGADFPLADGAFDRVLVDAPCSGLGTLRRDPDIKWKRTPADLPALARTQVELLQRAARVVRAGGRLVYSTCSSEPEENEHVIAAFLAQAPAFKVAPLQSLAEVPDAIRNLHTPEGFLRTDPASDGLEAFFGAVLHKSTSVPSSDFRPF
jgi:16S rRNA (cytosine967-C5)-methyltransferase